MEDEGLAVLLLLLLLLSFDVDVAPPLERVLAIIITLGIYWDGALRSIVSRPCFSLLSCGFL